VGVRRGKDVRSLRQRILALGEPHSRYRRHQALGRVLTDEVAPLREPAMVLISALLTGEEGPSLVSGANVSRSR
jgi:hypothetical protein